MAPIVSDPDRIRSFATAAAFERWLRRHHDREPELWLRVYKKGSGVPSVTTAEALDVALCWGWIDAVRKRFDAESFLQRYTPRQARSRWSQVNCRHVARLTAEGRMALPGRRAVETAKADGRWDAAYAPIREASVEALPADLRAAIDASPRARAMLPSLTKQNLFALSVRTLAMKTTAGRARKIASLVAMLERGETIVPQGPPRASRR